MDLTVCVMLPSRGEADYSRSAHTKMPVLAPVCVFERQNIEEVFAPRTGYIHVSDCPVRSPQELAEKLCVSDTRITGEVTVREIEYAAGKGVKQVVLYSLEEDPTKDPHAAERGAVLSDRVVTLPVFETLAKRAYEADVSQLPAKVRAVLLAERQCSLTWVEFAAMYGHRETREKLSDVVQVAGGQR